MDDAIAKEILKELEIQNLLSVMNIRENHIFDPEDKNDVDKAKVLNYIYSREIGKLKLNVVLFPPETKDNTSDPLKYNFHSVR